MQGETGDLARNTGPKPTDRDRMGRILEHLNYQLLRGQAAATAARTIHTGFENRYITPMNYFFWVAQSACISEMILTCSLLLDPGRNTVSIHYLVNYAESHVSAFPPAMRDRVLQSVARHRRQLGELSGFAQNVSKHRSQRVAHLDRNSINNPEAYLSLPPADLAGIERTFETLLQMVNTYEGLLNDSGYNTSLFRANVRTDLEHVFSLLAGERRRGSQIV